MAARVARSLAVVAAGAIAAAALFFLGAPKAPEGTPPEVTRLARALDGRVREAAAAVRSRASTLADLPRLSVAVATDAATVQDLTQEELAFRLKPGETIEIGQVRAGAITSLLRMPVDAVATPGLDKPGTSLRPDKDGVLLSDVVNITPSVQTGVDLGILAVTWQLDLRPELQSIPFPARVELAGRAVAASAVPFGAAEPVSVPLGDHGLTLLASPPAAPGGLTVLQMLGLALGGVGVLAGAFLATRKAPPAAPETVVPPISAELPEIGKPFSPAMAGGYSGTHDAITQFGRYSVIRKLGSGGMAEVFLARISGEAGFNKEVALKIMHRNLAASPEVVDHFLDEARLASRLTHPNIVQISDLGRSGDDYFIAMEYVEGYDLDYILDNLQQRGALVPIRVGLAITRKICVGLDAAHGALAADGSPLEIVHRDVKAENVLISRRGEVKVADFGIAKANQRSRVTQFGMVKGTAAYMAPEHRVGRVVDKRADVYGVGAVLYELMAGKEINLDLENLAHLGREGWPHLTPISTLRSDVPADIDAIIWKALSYDREDRYASCAALEEALEAFAVKHGLEVGDKAILQWMEREVAFLERPAS